MKLRDYQQTAVDKTMDFLSKNPDKNPLVAMPTGSGKSLVISDLIRRMPSKNILVLSHVKEILGQNAKAIENHTNQMVSTYAAGLNSKEVGQITVASIQSACRAPALFKRFDVVIIDECHLIPPKDDSMYRSFLQITGIKRRIGLTATPFRLGAGYIYGQPDSIFDEIVVDLTTREEFSKLIEAGYLCKLKTQATTNEFDTEEIRTVAGDFDIKGMSNKFDREGITNSCVKEIIKNGKNYKKWLVFAIDIDHAEHIAETLIRAGIPAAVVHSKMDGDRDHVIELFKSGFYRCVVNVDILTTGFDVPSIDLVALLRPTKSPVIHVQTIGRGTRPFPGKDHCLILDFAGNTERLGPINDVHVYVKKKGKGDPITKRCPDCDTIHHPSVRICPFCGHKFQFKTMLDTKASNAEVVMTEKERWYKVDQVIYMKHQKQNTPDMLKVTYVCGFRGFTEYVCLEHPGYAGHKGKHWVHYRGGLGQTVDEVLNENLASPTKIKVNTSQKYPIITDFSFERALLTA